MGLLDYSGEGKVKEVQAKENKRRKKERGECKGEGSEGLQSRERERGEARRGEVGISLL